MVSGGVFRVCFNHELTIWVFDMEAMAHLVR